MIIDHLFTRPLFESQMDPITQFASNAHEEWRRNFDPTGTKPRIKKNSDGTEGDINVPFADLHPDWQKENLAAGHAAHRAVKHFGHDMEKAAEYVHSAWMKRNPKGDWNAAQHVPYDDLPEDEKEKDRVHVRTMMKLMGHHHKQGVEEVAPPGAKAERMVKHIKAGYARDGKLTPREKGIAYAKAWEAHNAGRVEEQGVAEAVNPEVTNAGDDYTEPSQNVRMGDFEFNARTFTGGLGNSNARGLQIRAYDPSQPKGRNSIGSADFIVKSDKKGNQWLESDDTEVNDEYRGKGIASMMYAFAKSLGNDVKASPYQSKAGSTMWNKWGSDAKHLVGEQGVAEGSLNEFAPGGSGDSGDYLRALASAWYNDAFDTGSLQKGIKSQQDVERLLNRGIVCPDGKTRKLHIDYNSDFDGVEIYSDDYYNHGDESGELDSRTGQPWGPYDHMEFKDEELDEGVAEGSDPSGLYHAGRTMNKVWRITAEVDGKTKRFKVNAQSSRTAQEKFMKRYPSAHLHNVEDITQMYEQGVAEGEESGAYYCEQVAQQIFNKRQDITSEDEVLNQAYHIVSNDLGQKRARYMFNYDEDFSSDVVSNYFYMQEQGQGQGVAEDYEDDEVSQGTTEQYGGIYIYLEDRDDDGEVFVQAMYKPATDGSTEMGYVLFAKDGNTLLPQDLEVEEKYQGQGIAATMYDYVKSKGYKIRRSGQQTDAGAGFWDKHRPNQNVWEQGVAEGSVYKKDQDLSSVPTQELEAFVNKHWFGGIPTYGQGESVKRAMRELRRRQKQGVAEAGDTAKGQKQLAKVHHRAADRVTSKQADKDPEYARKAQQTQDRAWDRLAVKEQGVAEGGPFSYGAKKPRKGSVADLAAKKRQEQEKSKQPIEPKDQMVGVAKVTKGVAEGFLNEGQYEMMMRNGQVKKFIAKDDADAKRIAAGHGAKSVIKLRGGVPAGKIAEQGVSEEGYGNHPSQRVDPRTGKKYVPPKSPLGQGVAEVRMSAAQRLSNAWDKQRAKSDASLRRTPSSIPKKEEPAPQEKQVAKKIDESRRARQALMARIANSR